MRDELDLRLVDVAAFHASYGPVLKAGTRRDNALNCRTGLASRTARTLGGERRRLRIGHGIDPGKVTIGDYLNEIRVLEVPPLPPLMSRRRSSDRLSVRPLRARSRKMPDAFDDIIDRKASRADVAHVATVIASDSRFAVFGTAAFAMRLLPYSRALPLPASTGAIAASLSL
jgi:hypothetical protein